MQTVNIHEAKTHLSRLIDGARQGEAFIIAKAGKPVVKVLAIAPENGSLPASRLGFMKGMMTIPDDFDRMGGDAIAQMFAGHTHGNAD
jgi:prevent-host-death family protein